MLSWFKRNPSAAGTGEGWGVTINDGICRIEHQTAVLVNILGLSELPCIELPKIGAPLETEMPKLEAALEQLDKRLSWLNGVVLHRLRASSAKQMIDSEPELEASERRKTGE